LRAEAHDVRMAAMSEAASRQQKSDAVDIVIISYVEPLSTLHIRAASIAVRRAAPGARVMGVVWQEMTDDLRRLLGQRLRVDAIAHSVSEAVDDVQRLMAIDRREAA
jgi:hypothetical protein